MTSIGLYEIRNGKGVRSRVVMDDRLGSRMRGARRIGDAPMHFGGFWGTVRMAASRFVSRFRRAASYVAAEASMATEGPLPAEKAQARLAACRSCEHRQVVEGKGEFCGKCGCGTRSRAELTIKTRMPGAKCPVGRWTT